MAFPIHISMRIALYAVRITSGPTLWTFAMNSVTHGFRHPNENGPSRGRLSNLGRSIDLVGAAQLAREGRVQAAVNQGAKTELVGALRLRSQQRMA
jgi:hypothetical protein